MTTTLLVTGTLAALALGLAFFVVARDRDLPRIDRVNDYDPPRSTRVLDRNGVLLGEIYRERRSVVALERIPRLLRQAVVAAEDADFYTHAGLDYPGMLRAFFINLRAGRFAQGGSTITQQVVKTFFLSPERTVRRKMQEVVLARRLEQKLSKDEILWLYLNQIYFGHGRYGVQEASLLYFGHGVDQLTLGQAALLAGLPQAPEALSPLKHPEKAKARQRYVLEQMQKLGMVEPKDAQATINAPLPLGKELGARPRVAGSPPAPEVIDHVHQALINRFGAERVPYLGANVTTTIDAGFQKAARDALEAGLRALDKRQGYGKPLRHLEGKALDKHLQRLAKHAGPVWEAVVVAHAKEKHSVLVNLGARRATIDLKSDARFTFDASLRPGDVLRVRATPDPLVVTLEQGPQGALVALEPATGQVRAMVGGYGFRAGNFNRALAARRQPGSAFKPIYYTAAIETGKLTAASVINDSPEVFASWKPKNYEDQPSRGPVRLRTALADSINTVAVKVVQDVGIDAAIAMAQKLGISSPLARKFSLALGASAVTPYEMVQAFATLAAGGKRIEPTFIAAINGTPDPSPAVHAAVSPEVAYVMIDLLRSAVEEGTGKAAKKAGRPAAGKTGTSDDNRDAWFVGCTPELCAAVWIGFDEPRSLGKGEAGGRAAVPVWADFVATALKGQPVRTFHQPSGIVVLRVDAKTGLRWPTDMTANAPGPPESAVAPASPPAPGSPHSIDEIFIQGTEPVETAPAPGEIDAETYLLEQLRPTAP